MQQGHELRIGNLVLNKENKICKVTQLVLGDNGLNISIRCSPPGSGVEEIYPIKLTQQILMAAGFSHSRTGSSSIYKKDEFSLNENFQLFTNYQGGVTVIGNRLEFVHQLQNLYQILTGKELTINLAAEDLI